MRRILREWRLPLHPELAAEGSDPAHVMVCGPSDSPKSPFAGRQVIVIEWRSPMGDDFYLEAPFADFVRALYGLPGEVVLKT